MRNLSMKIAAILMFASVSVFANDKNDEKASKKKKVKGEKVKGEKVVYQASIHKHKGNVVAVHFSKPTSQTVKITIKSMDGKVLFKETVKQYDMAVKKYVLDKFPLGRYQVEIDNGSEVVKEVVILR